MSDNAIMMLILAIASVAITLIVSIAVLILEVIRKGGKK